MPSVAADPHLSPGPKSSRSRALAAPETFDFIHTTPAAVSLARCPGNARPHPSDLVGRRRHPRNAIEGENIAPIKRGGRRQPAGRLVRCREQPVREKEVPAKA